MLDDNDNILFPTAPVTTEPIVEEEPVEVSLDELDAPDSIDESEDDIDLTVEYDETLVDDSDDFHGDEF